MVEEKGEEAEEESVGHHIHAFIRLHYMLHHFNSSIYPPGQVK
jgi:hypothetical protein